MLAGGLTEYAGFIVPEMESRRFLDKRVEQAVVSIDAVLPLCRRRRVAVQAGGNLGVWARRLADLFGAVYTAEPDALAFECLTRNTAGLGNVVRLQAALGEARTTVGLCRTERRSGATYVAGEGIVPTLRIDDLGLEVCDLIYLDIEGLEFAALKGATDTIERCRPVLAFEDKQHGARYGVGPGEIAAWLGARGYRDAGRAGKHDQVMVA